MFMTISDPVCLCIRCMLSLLLLFVEFLLSIILKLRSVFGVAC